MNIGHAGDMVMDERQRRDIAQLLHRLGFEGAVAVPELEWRAMGVVVAVHWGFLQMRC
mgnify:CR=1 FL=1